MKQLEFHAMGCRMMAALERDNARGESALAEIPRRFEAWEQVLSRFRENSELCALNRRSGTPVHVSETLWQVTRIALQAAAESDGLVTPTVLDALEAAGYARSMSDGAPAGFANEGVHLLTESPQVRDWRSVRLDTRRRTIQLPKGVRLDLAGVAKGWAAEQAVRYLARFGPALVDASGDIAVSGTRADGTAWPVGIEHPLGHDEDLPLLLVEDNAVATSTRHYRRWMKGGRWQHHIIDPRTGLSAETDVWSATVVAPTAIQAEVAAKTLLILGSSKGLEWIEARPHLAALVILEDGSVAQSERFKHYTWEEKYGCEYQPG